MQLCKNYQYEKIHFLFSLPSLQMWTEWMLASILFILQFYSLPLVLCLHAILYSDVTGCDSNVDKTIRQLQILVDRNNIELLHEWFCGSLPHDVRAFDAWRRKRCDRWFDIELKQQKGHFSQSLLRKSCYGNWNEWKLEDGWINGVNKTGHKSRQGQEKEGRQAK